MRRFYPYEVMLLSLAPPVWCSNEGVPFLLVFGGDGRHSKVSWRGRWGGGGGGGGGGEGESGGRGEGGRKGEWDLDMSTLQ